MKYRIEGIDISGRRRTGTVVAESVEVALAKLKRHGIYATAVPEPIEPTAVAALPRTDKSAVDTAGLPSKLKRQLVVVVTIIVLVLGCCGIAGRFLLQSPRLADTTRGTSTAADNAAVLAARRSLIVRYAGHNTDIEYKTIEAEILRCADEAGVPLDEAFSKAETALRLAPSNMTKDRVDDLLVLLNRPDLFARAPRDETETSLYRADADTWPDSLVSGRGQKALVYTEESYDDLIVSYADLLAKAQSRLEEATGTQKEDLELLVRSYRQAIESAVKSKQELKSQK